MNDREQTQPADERRRNPHKIPVSVRADHLHDGRTLPRMFRPEEGEAVLIDRVLDVCEAAAMKAGGQGTRYTCRVQGKNLYLFCDRGFWFLEV